MPHDSHPLGRFIIYVRFRGERLDLVLAPDSKVETEYWVYPPDRGWLTDYNEIGRIHTGVLDHICSIGYGRPRRERRNR